jgi:hypothetical protein
LGCELIKRRNTSFENKSRKQLSWKILPDHAKAAVGMLWSARESKWLLGRYFREELVSRFVCIRVIGRERASADSSGKVIFL